MELLPTSRPLGIRPWMAASWERKQLGWQPVHSARAVSREAGQAGLRPPAPEQGPGQATRIGPSSSSHQRLKGVPSLPALSREQGLILLGPHLFSLAFYKQRLLWKQHVEQEIFKSNNNKNSNNYS